MGNKHASKASLPRKAIEPVVSSRLFTKKDVEVVASILGAGREFTAERMLEEAEKRLVQKPQGAMSGGWIHHDWVSAGLKIEEVPEKSLEAAVQAAKDASSSVLSSSPVTEEEPVVPVVVVDSSPVTEEEPEVVPVVVIDSPPVTEEEPVVPVVVVIDSPPSVTCTAPEPNVEVCVKEEGSAILYVKQPTSSTFKPSPRGSDQGSAYVHSDSEGSSDFSMDAESLEDVDGGFVRMANEDD